MTGAQIVQQAELIVEPTLKQLQAVLLHNLYRTVCACTCVYIYICVQLDKKSLP